MSDHLIILCGAGIATALCTVGLCLCLRHQAWVAAASFAAALMIVAQQCAVWAL